MNPLLRSKSLLSIVLALIIFFASVLFGAGVGVLAAPNQQQPTLQNTFGAIYRDYPNQSNAPKVTGVHGLLTAPSQPVASGKNAQNLIGVTWWDTIPYFVEAGARKACTAGGCTNRPYIASIPFGGATVTVHEDPNTNLGAGLLYEFRVFKDTTSGQTWTAHFCSGAGCFVLGDPNVGAIQDMYYASAGAEAFGGQFGPVHTQGNQWRKKADEWRNYCWEQALQTAPATISACNSSAHSWDVPQY